LTIYPDEIEAKGYIILMGGVADPFSVELQIPDVDDGTYLVLVQNTWTDEFDTVMVSVK
jgi:hypothetical protein